MEGNLLHRACTVATEPLNTLRLKSTALGLTVMYPAKAATRCRYPHTCACNAVVGAVFPLP